MMVSKLLQPIIKIRDRDFNQIKHQAASFPFNEAILSSVWFMKP